MEYYSRTGYRQSGNWRHYGDSRGWRYQPPYVPPPPPPIKQLSQRKQYRNYDLRFSKGSKYLEQRADGSIGPQQFRKGKSLPGLKPIKGPGLPGIGGLPKYKPLVRAGRLLGEQVIRLNPYIRIFNMAMDLYEAFSFDENQPWAVQGEPDRIATLQAAGWTMCCQVGTGGEPWIMNGSDGGIKSAYFDPVYQCSSGVRCGLGGQVTNKPFDYGDFAIGKYNNTHASRTLWIGKRIYIGYVEGFPNRAPINEKWIYNEAIPPRSQGTGTKPGLVRRVMPLPSVTPDRPFITDTYQAPSNPLRSRPKLKRYERPSIDIVVNPGGAMRPPTNGSHILAPPTGRDREKKVYASGRQALALLGKFYDGITEADEVVDILYDNLGKKCRAKGMAAKMQCIYNNLHTLDLSKAIPELIANHYEDKLWGRFYGYGKKSPFGYGLSYSRPHVSENRPSRLRPLVIG
jgi:hypothetical protein